MKPFDQIISEYVSKISIAATRYAEQEAIGFAIFTSKTGWEYIEQDNNWANVITFAQEPKMVYKTTSELYADYRQQKERGCEIVKEK